METSRRALSKASEGPPECACQSPATTTAAQSSNGPAAAAGRARRLSQRPIAMARTRAACILLPLVAGERRGDRRAGGLGQDAAVGIEELALGEGDAAAPAHHLADAL